MTPAPAVLPFVTPLMVGVLIVGEVVTNAVVASCVVAVPAVAVGAVGVPASAGDVVRTGPPEPVAALASPVATPVPRPDTPVEIGKPVAFVSVAAEGVPKFGVVKTGDVCSAIPPEPETAAASAAATPVPSPDMPVDTGRPVAFVSVAADGVPRLGVVSVGDVARTPTPVPVKPPPIGDVPKF